MQCGSRRCDHLRKCYLMLINSFPSLPSDHFIKIIAKMAARLGYAVEKDRGAKKSSIVFLAMTVFCLSGWVWDCGEDSH